MFIVLSTHYLMSWLHREQYNLEVTPANTSWKQTANDQVWNGALPIGAKDKEPIIVSFPACLS